MTYIENVFLCLAIPLILSLFFTEGRGRRFTLFMTLGMGICLLSACVGTRGARVNAIVEELNGEKVDIIKYSEDPAEFISAALSPADVIDVRCNPEEKTCRVIVPDDQLSLAIGKEGQNARLAAKLTGYKIDIKSESNADEVDEEELLDAVEPEEDDLLAEDSNALLDDGADVAEAQDVPAEEPEAEEEAAVEPAEDAEEAEE